MKMGGGGGGGGEAPWPRVELTSGYNTIYAQIDRHGRKIHRSPFCPICPFSILSMGLLA